MAQWEPLADRIPVDLRRLATQLRRMKDRSGMTVPALAARTAQSAESWERYLNGRQLPPLDAVEVLAQASGADYDRLGALWKMAERAGTGSGDRGRGKPVPYPDPLDPLGAEEGLPRRRRRALLLATAGVLAIGALVTVMLAAGPSTGRAPERDAGPTPTRQAATTLPTGRAPGATRGTSPNRPGGAGGPSAAPAGMAPDGGPPSPSSAAPPTDPPGTAPAGTVPPDYPPPPTVPSSGTVSAQPPPPPPTTATPTPTAPHTGLCLGLILLGICIGGTS